MAGTSRGHITNLKQSILETFDIYALMLQQSRLECLPVQEHFLNNFQTFWINFKHSQQISNILSKFQTFSANFEHSEQISNLVRKNIKHFMNISWIFLSYFSLILLWKFRTFFGHCSNKFRTFFEHFSSPLSKGEKKWVVFDWQR